MPTADHSAEAQMTLAGIIWAIQRCAMRERGAMACKTHAAGPGAHDHIFFPSIFRKTNNALQQKAELEKAGDPTADRAMSPAFTLIRNVWFHRHSPSIPTRMRETYCRQVKVHAVHLQAHQGHVASPLHSKHHTK
eukprot:1160189-Pelagomonas_calceolata.AAC.3